MEDFSFTLQYKNKKQFKVEQSEVENAGLGLFFKGIAKKDDYLCGFGGEVLSTQECAQKTGKGKYKVLCGTSGYVLDAQKLRDSEKIENIPLGHFVNRPPKGGKKNTRFCYLKTKNVLVLRATCKIDTNGEWQELYVSYNMEKTKKKQ